MDFYALIVRKIIAPLWAIKEGSPYLRHLKYLEKSQYFSLDKIRQIQWEKLIKLLKHAFENTEYYKRRFEEIKITPDDIKTWDDFSKFPLLSKDNIRNNRETMIAHNIPKSKLIPKKTSGSTGVSLEFFVDEDSLQWKRACTARHDRWAGWNIGERIAAIWGNPEYYKTFRLRIRNLLLDRYSFLDTLKMDESAMETFYHTIRKKSPAILFGHAHSLYLFASFLRSKGLIPPKPRGIISTAMVLHAHERQTIEDVFNAKVFNRYGCEEVGLIASECEYHQGLHMNLDNLVIEVIREGKPVPPGEPGSIVITDLSNYGMPLIRYKVGDVGIISESACACGRTLPLFKSIEGRAADYVVTPNGQFVSGISLTENFAMELPGVKQIQIVQDEIDHLLFRIVRANENGSDMEEKISDLVLKRFGPEMKYDVEYVEAILQEASGKYRFCISKIKNPFL